MLFVFWTSSSRVSGALPASPRQIGDTLLPRTSAGIPNRESLLFPPAFPVSRISEHRELRECPGNPRGCGFSRSRNWETRRGRLHQPDRSCLERGSPISGSPGRIHPSLPFSGRWFLQENGNHIIRWRWNARERRGSPCPPEG